MQNFDDSLFISICTNHLEGFGTGGVLNSKNPLYS